MWIKIKKFNQVIIKIIGSIFYTFFCLVIAIYMFKYPTQNLVLILSFLNTNKNKQKHNKGICLLLKIQQIILYIPCRNYILLTNIQWNCIQWNDMYSFIFINIFTTFFN